MKNWFLILAALLCFSACEKEKEPDPTPPPPPPDPVYVPIFQPGDTTFGAGYANKLTEKWSARVLCYDNGKNLSLSFFTYANLNVAFLREALWFGNISRVVINEYALTPFGTIVSNPGKVSTSYGMYLSDGDVVGDIYHLDSTATDNKLTITRIDTVAKRVEGFFTASFNIEEPRVDHANPKKVKFSEGRFWAEIKKW